VTDHYKQIVFNTEPKFHGRIFSKMYNRMIKNVHSCSGTTYTTSKSMLHIFIKKAKVGFSATISQIIASCAISPPAHSKYILPNSLNRLK
jgi:hypothetical protein